MCLPLSHPSAILVEIDGTPLYGANTWEDVFSGGSTWATAIASTYSAAFLTGGSGILMSTFSIEEAIEDHSLCDLTALSVVAAPFTKCQPVIVRDECYEVIYGGVIDSVSTNRLPGPSGKYFHELLITDWHYLAQKRIVAFAMEHRRIDEAVRYIYDTYLYHEGVRMGAIQVGATIEQLIFSYIPASDALDRLAEYSTAIWFISSDRKFYFIERNTYAAPFQLVKAKTLGEPTLIHQSVEYRNKQFIRGGQEETDMQTEEFLGDGYQRTFAVGYPIGRKPTILVNGVSQTVGIFNETEKDWIWSKGSNQITQNTSADPMAAASILTVRYVGLYNIMAVSSSAYEIYARRTVEGIGTGLVESISDNPSLTTKEAALSQATALIDRYGSIGRKLEFRTREKGLAAGQVISVDITELDITPESEFLITRISLVDQNGLLVYEVEACEGPVEEGWVKVFAEMMGNRGVVVLREGLTEESTLIGLYDFYHLWLESEDPTIFKDVYPEDSVFASTSGWPCFAPEDKLKYMVLEDAIGNEILRKFRTVQTITDDLITTTVFVNPAEGIGDIISVALWGGNLCTSAEDSGIELSRHAWVKSKTSLESLQMEFTDEKWYESPYVLPGGAYMVAIY